MLLGHLHQTHQWSKVPTQENREQHYFLITVFWWLICLQVSQTCLFTPAWRAICRRNCKLSWHLTVGSLYLNMEQALLCDEDPACRTQLLWQPPAKPLLCWAGMGLTAQMCLLCHNPSVFLGRGIFPSSILRYNKAMQTKRYRAPEHQGGEYTHILGCPGYRAKILRHSRRSFPIVRVTPAEPGGMAQGGERRISCGPDPSCTNQLCDRQ